MAINARGLYLAKDLEAAGLTASRLIGARPVTATYRRKGKQSMNRTDDPALRTRENIMQSNTEGDLVTRCHRPGCMRYIWLSQTDDHLAFHNGSEDIKPQPEVEDARSKVLQRSQSVPSSTSTERSTSPASRTEEAELSKQFNPPPSQQPSNAPSVPLDNSSKASEVHPLPPPKACLACLNPIPPGKSYTLTCNHVWCQSCVRLKFRSSTQDLSLWPPTCCPGTKFSMHVTRRILGTNLVNELNERSEELEDKKRVYCCVPDCGAYIGAKNKDLLGDVAKCGKCGGVMCLICKSAAHPGKGCRDDEETRKFLEVVEREGYRKCKGCGTMCELMEGCNHITCENCGYQFCYLCGAQNWRCGCPVISDGNLDRRINEARRLGLHGLANGYEHQRGQNNDGSNRADGELGPAGLPWEFIGW